MVAESDIREKLWNDDESERFNNDTFNRLLIEQYKMYVELFDRVSSRRIVFNTFFLTLHAILVSALGISLHNHNSYPEAGMLAFPLIGLLVLCYAWWRLVQYFRRVVSAKEKVIQELERRLPCNPTFSAEYKAMSVDRPYNSLRRIEIILPYIFAALYLFSYAYILYNVYS